MNIEYIKREINLRGLTDSELPNDIQWLVNYFKGLTYRYEKNNGEIWYDKNDQWTIQMVENRNYVAIFYKNWNFLEVKYKLNYQETSNLCKVILEFILNRKVGTPRLWCN